MQKFEPLTPFPDPPPPFKSQSKFFNRIRYFCSIYVLQQKKTKIPLYFKHLNSNNSYWLLVTLQPQTGVRESNRYRDLDAHRLKIQGGRWR